MDKEIKEFLEWFVWSSENPQLVSRTIKGLLVVGASQIYSLSNEFGVTLPYDIASVISAISNVALIIGIVLSTYGMIRKVANSLKDESGK